jgi:hypothetical protein
VLAPAVFLLDLAYLGHTVLIALVDSFQNLKKQPKGVRCSLLSAQLPVTIPDSLFSYRQSKTKESNAALTKRKENDAEMMRRKQVCLVLFSRARHCLLKLMFLCVPHLSLCAALVASSALGRSGGEEEYCFRGSLIPRPSRQESWLLRSILPRFTFLIILFAFHFSFPPFSIVANTFFTRIVSCAFSALAFLPFPLEKEMEIDVATICFQVE